MLVLVDFQNDYHSINYWIIYLVSIPRIVSNLQTLNFILFFISFHFYFYLSFFYFNLRLEFSMMSHITVTITIMLSHDHMSQWNIVEGSRRNNITIAYLTYINLKNNIWP